MRRLIYCLLAAAWFVIPRTTFAVEFKIDDAGSSTVRAAVTATAPAPARSPVYSPPSAARIAQLPSETYTDGATTLSVGDVFESPIDGATTGDAVSTLVEDLGTESYGSLENNVVETLPQEFMSVEEQQFPYTEDPPTTGGCGCGSAGCGSNGPSCSETRNRHQSRSMERWRPFYCR